MNERKRISNFDKLKFVLILILCFTVLLPGITMAESDIQEVPDLNISSPSTVAALPLFWALENNMLDFDANVRVMISPDHQRAVSLLAQEELDMIITGVNVGARAFNRGIDIRLVNTNIWGINYLLTYGFELNTWDDLKGKTLSLPLQGGPLDFIARYLMINNGLSPDEVNFVYRPLQNGSRMFQLGNLDSIILPEPILTITSNNTEGAHMAMDIQEEWGKINDGDQRIPYVGLFVRGAYSRRNTELVENINYYYKQGVEWVNNNPEEAAKMAEKYFDMPAPIIQQSLDRTDLNIYPRDETFTLINLFFNKILEMYPEMIGGSLPNELFYF
ncbi:ABC transporter substrate-binding protein [Natronospora cellulosivora (SeqCode)]